MSDERTWQPVFLSDEFRRPGGAYSPATRSGDFVFASGMVPVDQRTGSVVGTTVAEQTRAVFGNISNVLQAAGATLNDIVSVTAYLADIKDWDEFDATYRTLLTPPFPSRTTMGVQLHGVLVEITVVARTSAGS